MFNSESRILVAVDAMSSKIEVIPNQLCDPFKVEGLDAGDITTDSYEVVADNKSHGLPRSFLSHVVM